MDWAGVRRVVVILCVQSLEAVNRMSATAGLKSSVKLTTSLGEQYTEYLHCYLDCILDREALVEVGADYSDDYEQSGRREEEDGESGSGSGGEDCQENQF